MIDELPPGRLGEFAADFRGAQIEMVTASVLAANTAARLWAASAPGVAVLLWDKGNNVFYFAGQAWTTDTQAAFADLIRARIRGQARAEGRSHFSARALTPALSESPAALFGDIPLHPLQKRFYRLDGEPAPAPSPQVGALSFAPIDAALLADPALENVGPVRAEIRWMWPSEARFLERGLGCVALDGPRVIGWCTAEYVSGAQCGIGIATDPAYERRGVATALAHRFAADCRRRGLTPHWECAVRNAASVRVAEKVGFTLLDEATVWAGEFPA